MTNPARTLPLDLLSLLPAQAPEVVKERTDAVYGCGGCTSRWTGMNVCHCAACHETFTSVGYFDRHRVVEGEHGVCKPPLDVIDGRGERLLFLKEGKYPRWGGPPLSEEARAKMRKVWGK